MIGRDMVERSRRAAADRVKREVKKALRPKVIVAALVSTCVSALISRGG